MSAPAHVHRERGQMAVFATLFVVVLVAITAVLIDGGRWLLENRNAQGVADAAAMAAVRDLAGGGSPSATAAQYVGLNGADGMTLDGVSVSGDEVRADVSRDSAGFLSGAVGIDEVHITATATARAMQVSAIGGALPFAFMEGGFSVDANEAIKVEKNLGPGNRGIVDLQMQPGCGLGSGGNDVRDAITGGACESPIGTTISTETGNTWGPVKQGLDARIGSNTQSFDDVFTWDPTTNRYVVADPESPRLGIVPIVTDPGGGTTWPNGSSPVVISSWAFVYIGNTAMPGYPPYTNSDKSVWVTPVRAVLPEELDAVFGDGFDPSSTSPIQFRLVD